MYLHIGNNVLLRKDEIIGIFNISALNEDLKGRKFMTEVKTARKYRDISEGKWVSLVLTDNEAYISRISPATLLNRSGIDVGDVIRMAELEAAKAERAAAARQKPKKK